MKRVLNIVLGILLFLVVAFAGIIFFKPGLDSIGARLDVDGDDYLTPDELPPILRREITAIDRNGDGRVGPAEFRLRLLAEVFRDKTPHAAPEYTGDGSWLSLGTFIGASIDAGRMQGAVLMLGYEGEALYQLSYGALDARTQLPVASASKWLTAAVMGALHDQGAIDIDRPLGEWAADLVPDDYESMTIAQMMAHVSGMDSRLGIVSAPTMDQAAATILEIPLVAEPGAEFRYGASSMMLAAWIAEQKTGKPWRDLARTTIFEPLGMTGTQYANPVRPLEYGLDAAPEVASGVHTTATDYMRFLAMIAGNGRRPDGLKILRAETIRKLELAQSIGAARVFVPPAVTHEFEYAMGAWCEQWDEAGQCQLLHSQGAFGTRPFVDRQTGVYGIFLILEDGARQQHIIQRVREVALETAITELSRP